MEKPKYSIGHHEISILLGWIESNQVAIPEIQRPFLWDTIKVRDLMDSLYQGFPIGFIISWQNPSIKTKDGSFAGTKQIIIDGQQRLTALRAAILGKEVVDRNYKKVRIHISFNPITEEFATLTPAIEKDNVWIDDISTVMKNDDIFDFVDSYCEKNPGADKKKVGRSINKLLNIKNKSIGIIEISEELDIETVTEIFIRINSKGVVLSQADFAMSKIATYGNFGTNLRKFIDYFCHLAVEPEFYKKIDEVDDDFSKTDYFRKITWLKNENDDLYDPDYSDVLRVSFTKEFTRGKLSELVSLLSGRNFETRSFEQGIIDDSFKKLEKGIYAFTNESNFKKFLMIIRSAGFITKGMINSQNALNFAYIVYLKLRELGYKQGKIEKYVKKWYLMSLLTSKFIASPESEFDYHIKNISKNGIELWLKNIEEAELSEAFWNLGLVNELNKATVSNPFMSLFFASQINENDKGFLSKSISIKDLISLNGDVHHIFPKDYLKTKIKNRYEYNQIANMVYSQSEINIQIGNKPPKIYLKEVLDQCNGTEIKYGAIDSLEELKINMRQNCIPENIYELDIDDYYDFLEDRRKLMAKKIERFYKSL